MNNLFESWSPYPQSFYVSKKYGCGLGNADVVTSTILWNLLSSSSRLPFLWEDGKVMEENLPSSFEHITEAKSDMFKLGKVMLGSLHDFYNYILVNDLSYLEITKYHGGVDQLRFVVRSRHIAKYGVKNDEDKAVLDIAKRGIWNGCHK